MNVAGSTWDFCYPVPMDQPSHSSAGGASPVNPLVSLPANASFDQWLQDGVIHAEPFRLWLAHAGVSHEQKQDLLGQALEYWRTNILAIYKGTRQAVRALIESGANPLAPIPGEESRDPHRPTFVSLLHRHPDIALHLVNMLHTVKLETGHDRLAPNGNTVLHVLCEQDPQWLGNTLDSAFTGSRVQLPPTQTMSLPQRVHLHPAWINHANDNQRTPLHMTWDRATYCMLAEPSNAFRCWDTSQYLLHLGGSLLAPDNQGKTPAQMLLNCVLNGLEVPTNIDIDEVRSQWEAYRLDQAAPARPIHTPRRTL